MSTQQPTPKTAPRITPLRETWQQLMSSARSRAPQLRASLIGLGLAAARARTNQRNKRGHALASSPS